MDRLIVGSLFSGIGGFDLGLERAGMRVVWQCESDSYCRRVLAKRWPDVPCYPDVRALVADPDGDDEPQEPESIDGEQGQRAQERRGEFIAAGTRTGSRDGGGDHAAGGGGIDGGRAAARDAGVSVSVPYVDVLAGGFPCQDLSYAGKGAGIDGSRSGLWRHFARLIGELRPRYVIVENVPALASRGLDRVLADLAACGFDAEWDHLPASAFGAPHRRDRLWLVAYPNTDGGGRSIVGVKEPRGVEGARRRVADRLRDDREQLDAKGADAERSGLEGLWPVAGQPEVTELGDGGALADTESGTVRAGLCEGGPGGVGRGRPRNGRGASVPWELEPDVGRVAHGIPARVDRLRGLGNALVPQIAEWIGGRIVEWELGADPS